ncbi:TonB family protein [Carboxylicivirga sp. RSCT41]|uniref:TonB family protein n=1 Tax=Carboxylicivirga agarovorans TaxID=3417570 RepID=UPI003D328739
MNTFIELQLKTGGIIAVSVLLFVLLLAKDQFFNRNRAWLLATLIVPWIVPVFAMPLWLKSLLFKPEVATNPLVLTMDVPLTYGEAIVVPEPIDWMQIGLILYAVVSLLLTVRLIWGYVYIHRLNKRGKHQRYKGFNVVLLQRKDVNPFSFFRTIYLPEHLERDINRQMILEHERKHCAQLHSIDISLAEWLLIIQWWNPFVWWLRKLIAQNHEYCVDNAMVRTTDEPRDYQYSLLQLLHSNKRLQLVNNFNQSLTKKRLVMMNKKHTNKILGWLKGLLVLPLVAAALLAFTNPDKTVVKTDDNIEINDEQGLRKHFAMTLKYPKAAQVAGFEGNVTVNFKVDNKGKVNNVNIGSSAGAITLDKVVVVAYAKKTGKEQGMTPSQDELSKLLEDEAKRVVEALPALQAESLKGKSIQIEFEFMLQDVSKDAAQWRSPKTLKGDELANNSISLTNSKGEKVTISTKGKHLKLDYDGVDMPFFTLNKDDISAIELEKLKVEDLGRISALTIEQLKQNDKKEWKNGVFAIYTKEAQAEFEALKPLYIVDGKEFMGDLEDISPDDIASMNVLKGESATNKYGEKAKDGAVEITTKNGLGEKGQLNSGSAKIKSTSNNKATPVFVVDGQKQDINNVNPENIDVVTVIKDPEVTRHYGEGAENGVILVKTKEENEEKVLFKSSDNVQISVSELSVIDENGESPLFIIDGEKQRENTIDADDIKSVNVLKGDQAVEKYGEDAKNGVIMIETKAAQAAEEVLVVGYGTMEKDKLSGTSNLLVRRGDKAENVRIKGLSGEQMPYIILDGEEYDGSLEELDAEDIESISVLKDKSAQDLYGDKAEHGVIIIKTKIK